MSEKVYKSTFLLFRMAYIFEHQSAEWKAMDHKLCVAQANHDRDPFADDKNFFIDWETHMKNAKQATLQELKEYFKDGDEQRGSTEIEEDMAY